MKRIPTILGALGVAILSALAVPLSAQAADGELRINDTKYEDPSGCITVDGGPQLLRIRNDTDGFVTTHSGANCEGTANTLVEPFDEVSSFGGSVKADADPTSPTLS